MASAAINRAEESARASHACDKKEIDINGFWYFPDNPLSKVGVFPYRGYQIPGAPDPNAIYQVYRPEEELGSQAAIDSFKLTPWVDDHAMLGDEELGLTPAEKKGVHGVIGDSVYFKDGTLYGDIKVFSEALKNRISRDKKELSCGYRCKYEPAQGVFDGQPYDYIQRVIRGNHLALVDSGRMGADVRVMDAADVVTDRFVFTCDSSLETYIMAEPSTTPAAGGEPSGGVTLDQVVAQLNELIKAVAELKKGAEPAAPAAPAAAPAATDQMKPEGDGEVNPVDEILDMLKNLDDRLKKLEGGAAPAADADPVTDPEKEKKDAEAMDAAVQERVRDAQKAIVAKTALAGRLSEVVGTFDHSLMLNEKEVAAYGCQKLGVAVEAGQELATLNGYLARKPAAPIVAAQDAAPKASWLADQLNK